MQMRVGPKSGYYPAPFFLTVRFVYSLIGKRGTVVGIGMVFSLVKRFLVKCCVQEDSQEMYVNSFLKKKNIYHGLTTGFHVPSFYPGSYIALHSPSSECKHPFGFFPPCFFEV